jgi:hypothetical protein
MPALTATAVEEGREARKPNRRDPGMKTNSQFIHFRDRIAIA